MFVLNSPCAPSIPACTYAKSPPAVLGHQVKGPDCEKPTTAKSVPYTKDASVKAYLPHTRWTDMNVIMPTSNQCGALRQGNSGNLEDSQLGWIESSIAGN